MAEEHRCQAPRLCANNCGFFGSPATQDLCSKCHLDLQLKEQQSSTAVLALNQSLAASSSSTPPSPPPSSVTDLVSMGVVNGGNQSGESQVKAKAKANRCVTCRRRVGLTGFECRCGMTFCGSHRYPEQHGCTFDFKGMGREQIAQANPVIKAEKLDRI